MNDLIVIDQPEEEVEGEVKISVSKEFYEHFVKIRNFRDELYDEREGEDPKVVLASMKAFTDIIKEMANLQQNLHNSETFALLQQRIVNVLQEVSPKLADQVLEGYAEDIRRLSGER